MGFPWKKGQGADNAAVSDAGGSGAVATATKPKKVKPNELLSSVVNESAVGSAVDRLKQNDSFALPGGFAWVTLMLSAEAIGGLSQKHKSDEAKGSLIQSIESNHIEVVATAQMLKEQFMSIIPTSSTLERMSEFNMLRTATYFWAVLHVNDEDGSLAVDPVADGTYEQALAVSRGDMSLKELLPEIWEWAQKDAGHGNVNMPEQVQTGMMDQVSAPTARRQEVPAPAVVESEMNEDPMGLDEGAFEPTAPVAAALVDPDDEGAMDYAALDEASHEEGHDAYEAAEEAGYPGEFVDGNGELHDGGDEEDPNNLFEDHDELHEQEAPVEDAYQNYVVSNESRVVTEVEVRDTIARRYLSGELDLHVDTAAFEATFGSGAAPIQIEMSVDGSDWLGSQVSLLASQANAELAQMHRGNVEGLREVFIQMMTKHVETVIVDVSTDRPGSQFKMLLDSAQQDYDANTVEAPRLASERRAEITERYDAEGQERAAQAAAHALVAFKNTVRPRMDRELGEVSSEIDRRNEEQYNHARKVVLGKRKSDAANRMEYGMTKILEMLMEHKEHNQQAEVDLLQHWNARLTQFIDENRKNDVARADALSDQLQRDNALDTLRNSQAAQLDELRGEYEARLSRLDAEMLSNSQQAIVELTRRENEYKHTIEREQERSRDSQTLVQTLNTQMSQMRDSIKAQYEDRIATLEGDVTSYSRELDRSNAMQVRSTKWSVVTMVVLGIVALLVGTILGWSWGRETSSPAAAIMLVDGWFGLNLPGSGMLLQ